MELWLTSMLIDTPSAVLFRRRAPHFSTAVNRQHILLGGLEPLAKLTEQGQCMLLSSRDIQLALANAFYQSGRASEAAVILESLIDKPNPPAAACVLYARLAIGEGRIADAVARYKQALEIDPDVADDELSTRLGVSPNQIYEEQDDEIFEGRVRHRGGGADGDFETELERPFAGR